MNAKAPIVVLAYNRPRHLEATLTSLIQCQGFADSQVLLFADGPRSEQDKKPVQVTREVAHTLLGRSAEYHFSETNKGLANSVIAAVSSTINRFGKAIVVEDDLELHPGFLTFMNRALNHYETEEGIYQISGYMFDIPELHCRDSAIFLPFTSSWGWATWARAWDQFDSQATGWENLKSDRVLRRRFNLDGAYDYATMLERQMTGLSDSWAICWYWSVFKAGGLVLFPPVSFVSNKGFDGSGTHGRGLVRKFSRDLVPSSDENIVLPQSILLKNHIYSQVIQGIRRRHGGIIARIVEFLRRII